VPGTPGTVEADEAASVAEKLGYPVMVKAAGGGGGRGIRVVRDAGSLREAVGGAAREADAAFGNPALYVEKVIERARHVEVQVIADTHGSTVHLFERDCSIQRRRQKLIEESPSPGLDPGVRAEMAASAVRLAERAGYVNAGTVEFLLDADGRFHFIEMNTRIQVEHPVTEMVTGIDLVKEQLRVAAGEPLSFAQDDVEQRGAAIEFRINAEDPDADFAPSPGAVDGLQLPGGPGVRVDTALYDGYTVPPFYDSLIAKVVVWGRDREEAIARGRGALRELRVGGIRTTAAFHLRMLEDEGFRRGEHHTEYLAERAPA